MRDKARILLLPTIYLLIALIVGYTFINWVFFIKLAIPLAEMYIQFFIPMAIAFVCSWFIIKPRLRLLQLDAKRGNWRDFYAIVLVFIFCVPLIIAQEYLKTASGQLTHLHSIREISKAPATRYYTVENFYLHKEGIGAHPSFTTSGKYNTNFDMTLYVVIPFFSDPADTSTRKCAGYLGVQYKHTVSNSLSDEEKERAFKDLALRSQQEFDQEDQREFVYLERVPFGDAREGYLAAIKTIAYPFNDTVLLSVNEPFEARNGSKLEWLIGSSLVGLAIWSLMVLLPKTDETHVNRLKEGKPDQEEIQEWKEILSFFTPKPGFFVTPIIMYLNIGVFLLMVIMGLGFLTFTGADLLEWGANYGPSTKDGQWWRLLTSTFLHGGFVHLFANGVGLLFVGIFLEPIMGRNKYVLTYLSSGILASISSLLWYNATVSVGASGAIFGLEGALLAFMLTKVFPPEFSKAMMTSTLIFIGYNLLMGLTGGVDNAAHIGGLLSGFIIGLILSPGIKKEIQNKEKSSEGNLPETLTS
jgi:membrane associated rhomboid family serine protease